MSCSYSGCTRTEVRAGSCLFHLPSKDPSEVSAFTSYVGRQIEGRGSGDLNFAGFVFPAGFQIRDRNFANQGNFAGAVFEGEMLFERVNFEQGAIFNAAKFTGALKIKDTTFGTFPSVNATTFDKAQFAKVDFERAHFNHLAQFNDCNFSGDLMFDHTRFLGNANFQGCTFSGQANFLNLEFQLGAVFSPINGHSTLFADYVTFAQTIFRGSATFESVRFFRGANFDNAQFSGYVSFSYAKFEGRSTFFGAVFGWQVHFNETEFRLSEFIQTTFTDVTSFKAPVAEENKSVMLLFHFARFEKPRQVSFLAIPFESLSFLKTGVAETLIVPPKSGKLGKGILDEELYLFSKGQVSSSKSKDDLRRGVEILASYLTEETVIYEYKNLRQSLESNRLFNEAAELFVHEMRMARKRSGFSFEFVASWLYDKISLFGESIKRPVLLSVAVTIGIASYVDVINNWLALWGAKDSWTEIRILCQWFLAILSDVVTVFFQMRSFPSTLTLKDAPVWAEIFLRVSSIVLLGNLFVAVKRRLERK